MKLIVSPIPNHHSSEYICPIHRKRKFHKFYSDCTQTRPFYHRVRSICLPDTHSEEGNYLRPMPIRNEYPAKFIEFHNRQTSEDNPTYRATNEAVCIRLALKRVHIPNDICHELNSAIHRTFPTAYLRILPSTRGIILIQRGSSRMSHSALHLLY